jgi:predicted AlkP superfamily pyrophosphatase or phosphodiesterase
MPKLLVFCIDALCSSDVEQMRSMPHFGPYLQGASLVKAIEPVWPALTYCCHASIITGCYVDRHHVDNNERTKRGGVFGLPWHCMKSEVAVPTLLDRAKEHGLTTCSLSWPVSGGADYDLNMPMIVPYHYEGWNPEPYLEGTSTQALLDRYFYRHGRYIKGPDRSLDLYTMALALDILQDYPQSDVMLVKMCDLDSARHRYGVHNDMVSNQLRRHDEEFGALLEALRRKGNLDDTNIVILGDHGQTDIKDVIHINVLLREAGLIKVDEDGKLVDFDAIAHSNGLTGYIELKNPDDKALRARVRAFLEGLKTDERFKLAYVLDAQEAKTRFHAYGPFDFVFESSLPIAFGERFDLESMYASLIPGNHKNGAATHGGSPQREELTTFIAKGPSIRPGIEIDRRSMVDEAPTMAAMLGFEMEDVDGKAIKEMIK